VHGFWSYQRVASLVNFIFYKASMVAITMYFFGFFSGFSGTQFFNDAPYQLYNVMYTALPVIAVAVLDRVLPQSLLENTPEAYAQQKGTAFTASIFARWILRSCLHGLCIFFVPVLALDGRGVNVAAPGGQTHDWWVTSTVVYFAVVLVPTFMILYEMNSWTFLHMTAIAISVFTLYFCTWLINLLSAIDPDLYGVVDRIYANANAWLTLVMTVGIPLIVELTFRYAHRQFSPTYTEVLQEHDFIVHSFRRQASQPRTGAVIDEKEPSKPVKTPQSPARHDHTKAEALLHLKTLDAKSKEWVANVGSDKLQAAVIKSMLRFRNLTGSQYDSAAQARLQNHDKFVRSPNAAHGEDHKDNKEPA